MADTNFSIGYVPKINSIDDVRAEAARLTKKAKSLLETSPALVPMAFIVKPDGTVSGMTRNTEPGLKKEISHRLVVEAARVANAAAVILITDVWYKSLKENQREEFLRTYRNGDLGLAGHTEKREALCIHVYGPFGQYVLVHFYHRAAGGKVIVWDEETELNSNTPDGQFMTTLLSPWWDTSKQPQAS